MGYVFHHEDSDPAKKLTFSKIVGTRRRDRPATKWLDCIEKDLMVSEKNRWRRLATSRTVWRKQNQESLGLY